MRRATASLFSRSSRGCWTWSSATCSSPPASVSCVWTAAWRRHSASAWCVSFTVTKQGPTWDCGSQQNAARDVKATLSEQRLQGRHTLVLRHPAVGCGEVCSIQGSSMTGCVQLSWVPSWGAGSAVQRGPHDRRDAADDARGRAGPEPDRRRHRHLSRARLQPHEGSSGALLCLGLCAHRAVVFTQQFGVQGGLLLGDPTAYATAEESQVCWQSNLCRQWIGRTGWGSGAR